MPGVVKQSLAVGGPNTVTISCVYDGSRVYDHPHSEDGTQGKHYRQRSKDNDRRQSNGSTAGSELMVIGAAFDPIEVTPIQLISGSKSIQGWAVLLASQNVRFW